MSSIARPPESPRHAGRPADDVDDLLRAFFRSEVPAPWPVAARDERGVRPAVLRPGIALSSRFAMAAAVVLFVSGFWSLSNRFPAESTDPGATMNMDGTLGAKEPNRLRAVPTHGGAKAGSARSGEAVEPTRNGGEALLQWEQLPGGLFMRIEEKRPPRR